MKFASILFISLFCIIFSYGESLVSIESFKNTKGWEMAKEGSVDPAKPREFIINRDGGNLLSNGNKKSKSQYLTSKKQWADQEVNAEFMITKGSNSGLYLLGRYEIQILDSYGKKEVGSGDMGGVYSRFDSSRGDLKLSASFEGTAPMLNAALPHGEWQTLSIKFRAPRFDKSGYKVAHAHFIEVRLNGKVVQKGVNVKGPTRAAPLAGDDSRGPLVIQGDHGPVLFRKLEVIERDYTEMKLDELPVAETFPLDEKNHPQINSVALGKEAFTNRGCIECHASFADNKIVKTGPSLYGVFQRKAIERTVFDSVTKKDVKVMADKNYFLASLSNPTRHLTHQTIKEEKGKPYLPIMPAYNGEMILSHEVDAVYDYLLTLNSGEDAGSATVFRSAVREKVSDKVDPFIIEVADQTMVVRGFVGNKTSARSIHVGQVNGQNFSFDPRTLAIQSIWTGGFLDMRNEVNGRGGKPNKVGAKAKVWPAPFTNILQPLNADGKTAFDGGLTNSLSPDTLKRTVSFYDQLKAINGKLLGYTTGEDNPTFHYLIDGNMVNLNFSITSEGGFSATLTGKLKQDLTLIFPASAFNDVKVNGGILDTAAGTWTLSSLDSAVTWTATPAKPFTQWPVKKANRIQPSAFEWTDEKAKLDIIPGFSVQKTDGPMYTDGTSPLFEPTGIDFDRDGTPVIGSRAAGIWKIKEGKWQPYALGTFELLGLTVKGNGDLVVCQKPEVSLIKDSDKDGVADEYHTLSGDYRFTGNYHAYNHGPAVDSKGNIHYTLNLQHAKGEGIYKSNGPYMGSQGGFRGWNLRIGSDGEFSPYAVGFRSAAGLAFSPDDKLYSADNQGEFMATSRLNRVEEGKFYGHPSGLIDLQDMSVKALEDSKQAEYIETREQSSVLLPHGHVANSPGHPVWDTTQGKFGPFEGQIFIGDQTLSNIHRIQLETVDGVEQGSIMPFVNGLPSGPMRLSFSPSGEMWAGQTGRGWASRGGNKSALQKFKWDGKVEQAIHSVRVTSNGFEVQFTQAVAKEDRASYSAADVDSWYYIDSFNYGSPKKGQQVEKLAKPIWKEDGTSVIYEIEKFGHDPEREKVEGATSRVFRINLHKTAFGKANSEFLSTAYYTLNAVPKK